MKKYIPFAIFGALTVLWVAFIWSNSAQSGVESGEQSSRFLGAIKGFFDSIGIDISISERFIRKFGHFSEYLVLSLLLSADVFLIFKALDADLFTFRKASFFALPPVLSAFVALFDEFVIQAMTEGRGPSIFDVMIDTSGAVVGALLFVSVLLIVARRRSRHIPKGGAR